MVMMTMMNDVLAKVKVGIKFIIFLFWWFRSGFPTDGKKVGGTLASSNNKQ
jgi:hypothetical protein